MDLVGVCSHIIEVGYIATIKATRTMYQPPPTQSKVPDFSGLKRELEKLVQDHHTPDLLPFEQALILFEKKSSFLKPLLYPLKWTLLSFQLLLRINLYREHDAIQLEASRLLKLIEHYEYSSLIERSSLVVAHGSSLESSFDFKSLSLTDNETPFNESESMLVNEKQPSMALDSDFASQSFYSKGQIPCPPGPPPPLVVEKPLKSRHALNEEIKQRKIKLKAVDPEPRLKKSISNEEMLVMALKKRFGQLGLNDDD